MPKPMELSVKNNAPSQIDSGLGCQDIGVHANNTTAKINGSITVIVFDKCLA